ncbi:MAG: hypothetical protein UU73_C0001G0090 [Candidatus Daviesbacteria bacterium GW2011_GWA1_41_61]|uniref:Uncharacterized protein n=1 Tax=Candidatus Daviesbacteria bacterium GW2011_GWA2_40_9 TaxID=1618424 RepID=A0A0G0U1J2_9BACT|nr:MAG: hypothetical protein UU26_C0002G0013 [Candidatus Daviesbacteria bacterium GW2011_GWC1_40_9]KKR82983.1 MAG: hypothetical protein UU29_C0008G0092 [Candidatus Daviesbacteria bacterium GW2011_GWA2_40_9]KKR92909.1 MAG: hypothetical protein UU44_C0004G0091 [Candidatus Daviesbacteria bacterium GW2011_GWB1_41_15]KKS15453.1 MAG: hypothetical protein UU73_C0001G0090 [Candidatus Daviesbacteria bacterium GW2011_GWA1_41_61]
MLKTPLHVLKEWKEVRSGHVIFNPYATLGSVLKRKEDPLRPGEKLSFYNLLLAENAQAQKALHSLETAFRGNFPVVTYNYKVNGRKMYGNFRQPLLQTHPAVFNDESNAGDLIRQVQSQAAAGIVYDCYHAQEATKSGNRPLGDWKKSLGAFLEAGVLKEVHVQAGRVPHNDPTVPSFAWLREMVGTNPNYNTELGQMIRMVKDAAPQTPFVVEITFDGLIKAGIVPATSVLGRLHHFQDAYKELAHYVRSV